MLSLCVYDQIAADTASIAACGPLATRGASVPGRSASSVAYPPGYIQFNRVSSRCGC